MLPKLEPPQVTGSNPRTIDDLVAENARLKGQLKFVNHSQHHESSFLSGWSHRNETAISVTEFYKEYRLQVIALNKENQELKHRIHYLEGLVQATEDEKAIVKTMNAVINDTSVTFKNKIYQDRHFYDTLCDQKDREYHRVQADYNNLILDHKSLCEKYAELEISKAKAESEASLKRADDQRVFKIYPDHKQTEWSAERLQRRQRKAEDRARHYVAICLDGESHSWQPTERPLATK